MYISIISLVVRIHGIHMLASGFLNHAVTLLQYMQEECEDGGCPTVVVAQWYSISGSSKEPQF